VGKGQRRNQSRIRLPVGARLQFEQEVLVEVLVFRHADVISGEGADRLLGLPERDHQEMCGIALDAT
jgi:hypothetical protein